MRHLLLCFQIWRNAKEIKRLNVEEEGSESSSGNVGLILFLAVLVVGALLIQAIS